MRGRKRFVNLALAILITTVTLWVLTHLRQLGDPDVQIENSWIRASGAIAGFVVIYELIRRTVFGRSKNIGD